MALAPNGYDATDFGATMTIALFEPIKIGGTTHEEITLQEPTAGALRDAERELGNGVPGTSSIAQLSAYKIAVVAAGARVNRVVIERMRMSQVNEAFAFLSPLLEAGQRIGETLSPTSQDSGAGDLMTDGR